MVDPAILRAFSLPPASAKMTSHGGSGFASTNRLTTPDTTVFVKTSSSTNAEVMFKGEHGSLNAIHAVVPSLCPKSLAWGKLEQSKGYFLATEFMDMGRGFSRIQPTSNGTASGMTLAQKLATLHITPAPIPEGFERPQFGFPVTTCCGITTQTNLYLSSWPEFFAKNRLQMILERSEENNGSDPELRRIVNATINQVIPRLLGNGHLGGKDGIKPVVVHGDLWSGNKGRGSFSGRGGDSPDEDAVVEDIVFDPSACYAHSEYEHGIMKMFGGFSGSFWKEYFAICPKTEPVSEYADRVALYESYHHLNHHAIFGGYRSGAVSLLTGLLKKYGSKT